MELFPGNGRECWLVGAGNQDQFPANRGFRAQAGCQLRRSRTRAGYGHPEATLKPSEATLRLPRDYGWTTSTADLAGPCLGSHNGFRGGMVRRGGTYTHTSGYREFDAAVPHGWPTRAQNATRASPAPAGIRNLPDNYVRRECNFHSVGRELR